MSEFFEVFGKIASVVVSMGAVMGLYEIYMGYKEKKERQFESKVWSLVQKQLDIREKNAKKNIK